MRRPLCAGLLVFLALWLPAALWAGRAQGREKESLYQETSLHSPLREGEALLLEGTAARLFEPADGSQENLSFALSD